MGWNLNYTVKADAYCTLMGWPKYNKHMKLLILIDRVVANVGDSLKLHEVVLSPLTTRVIEASHRVATLITTEMLEAGSLHAGQHRIPGNDSAFEGLPENLASPTGIITSRIFENAWGFSYNIIARRQGVYAISAEWIMQDGTVLTTSNQVAVVIRPSSVRDPSTLHNRASNTRE